MTSAFLSGDFVDYFAIDHEHCGFYMADVSGHGVSSAFVTVLLKSYMGGYLERHQQSGDPTILDPAAVFVWLDNYCQQRPLEPFKSALDSFVRARAARRASPSRDDSAFDPRAASRAPP